MPFLSTRRLVVMLMFLTSHFTAPPLLVTAYGSSNALLTTPQQPTSALASKVIFQSPAMENIYKEFIVSSKPLNLRKYANGVKTKKTKKDSKIYYIPIPPLPYRYIPGVGYDYQPMRIKPIMMESAPPAATPQMGEMETFASSNKHNSIKQALKPQLQQEYQQPLPQPPQQQLLLHSTAQPNGGGNINNIGGISESKMLRLQRGDYFFNGHPFRLQVANARKGSLLTPQNLKSNFYLNKKIIY